MRVLLFTGKGGVGKTTAAAATAVLAARRGTRTLVLSTDPAHSLADALDVPLGPEPVEIETGLYAQQVDSQRRFEQSWSEIRRYLGELFARGGLEDVAAAELTMLPGAEEVFALLELRSHLVDDRFDLVIVDCAPTAETLRLLALPTALEWYFDRAFGRHRRIARAVRPLLGRDAAVPADGVWEAVDALRGQLAEVHAMLTDSDVTAVRVVLTPESVVIAEARRTLTTLALHGIAVDMVVANRLIPSGDDEWRSGWVAAQADRLSEIRGSVGEIRLRTAPYLAAEPLGVEALARFAEVVYGPVDPAGVRDVAPLMTWESDDTAAVLSLDLPLVTRSEVTLSRSGDDLVVTVGAYRRIVALPAAVTGRTVVGAGLSEGRLSVRFGAEATQDGGAA